MQIIGIAYGTEKELAADRKRLQKFLDEWCEGGSIRKYEAWDIGFKKKYKEAVMHELSRPHPIIRKVIQRIIEAPIIGKALIKFITGNNHESSKFEIVNDTRPDVHNKSPDYNMIILRTDGVNEQGEENL